ncbi:AAA family ATPase [Psychromonas aquatilis]|uniref:endopeptidase La n=1 Tax=Psychromonas aquatilis TaxID=2005072 RepID=A0ABU9GMR4_9GAMM
MTNNISSTTSNDVANKPELVADNLQPLIKQQCTSDFAPLIAAYKKTQEPELLTLFPEAVAIIDHYLKLPTSLLLINSRHWQSAQKLLQQIMPEPSNSAYLLSYDKESLFGRISEAQNHTLSIQEGELIKRNDGVLTLNISPLLVDPSLWFSLKSLLQRGYLQASDLVNAEKIKIALPNLSSCFINTKIILVASRMQLEELIQIDPEYTQVSSLFCELPSQVHVSQSNINALINYCHKQCQELNIKPLDEQALLALFNHLSMQCQHQQQLLFSPEFIEQMLQYANLYTENNEVSDNDLLCYFDEIDKAQSLAKKYSEQSILEGQINLQLSGEKIGQINGLSVVELLGYPCEFGEIFRISASDMIGDGEIIDVERKVELAGNIHAKSTLIVQGYLNHFFSHIAAFPYSCNLVFEQSYQESDGDSASLAILIAVISCYSQSPVQQNVFVTGSLDQHGNVLPIGGINQKIESVTRLFELGLLSDPVKVLMPSANILNLTLNQATLALIETGKIVVYPIAHCHQAFPILLGKSFKQVITTINARIEETNKDEADDSDFNLLSRLKNALFS